MSAHNGSTSSVAQPTQSLAILKYPRTPHLEGSRLQPGDEGHEHVTLASLRGQHAVVEEKLDGANVGISFTEGGELLLQSRGHYLGGGRERHFALFKRWASAHEARLLELLEDRYVMYGEWLHAKHSVSYDVLPHWFCEFDIYDRRDGVFLSTSGRQALLAGSPVQASRHQSAAWRGEVLRFPTAKAAVERCRTCGGHGVVDSWSDDQAGWAVVRECLDC